MSSRYSEGDYGRYGRGGYDYERGYGGRGPEERGVTERVGEEVRSWFEDDDAERRRRMYEQRYGSRGYGGYYGQSGFGSYGRSYKGMGAGMGYGAGETSILIRLSDTDFDVQDDDDIRGCRVYDQDGNEIGKIDDLLIDPRQRRVCFLQVTSGGFFGIGGTMMLVPVEAITRINRDSVEIDRSGRASNMMRYNPNLIERRGAWETRGITTGRHRGRGPHGYKRSDDRIREDVNDRLSDDPYLDASGIETRIENGVVTLSGTVNDRNDRRRAEDIALMVPGVDDVLVTLTLFALASAPDVGAEQTTGAGGRAAGAAAGAGSTTGTTGTGGKGTSGSRGTTGST